MSEMVEQENLPLEEEKSVRRTTKDDQEMMHVSIIMKLCWVG
jgi:hypothetical protein